MGRKPSGARKAPVGIQSVVQILVSENELALHIRATLALSGKAGSSAYPKFLPADRIPEEIDASLTNTTLDINRSRIRLVAG